MKPYSDYGINYTRRGWRKSEPLTGKLEKERPRVLRRSVELLLSEKVQSISQILGATCSTPEISRNCAILIQEFFERGNGREGYTPP